MDSLPDPWCEAQVSDEISCHAAEDIAQPAQLPAREDARCLTTGFDGQNPSSLDCSCSDRSWSGGT